MTNRKARDRMMQALRAAAGGGRPVAEAGVAAGYFAGRATDPGAMRRLAQDPGLRREVAAVALLLDAVERPRRRATRAAFALSAVAAGAALFLALPSTDVPRSGNPTHRDGVIGPRPIQIETILAGRDGYTVVWTAAPGADRYVLEVTRDDGHLVFSRETADTTVVLPDSAIGPSGLSFIRVRARVAPGRWVTSDFRELTVP